MWCMIYLGIQQHRVGWLTEWEKDNKRHYVSRVLKTKKDGNLLSCKKPREPLEASRFHHSCLQRSTADISGPKVLHKQHLSFSRFYISSAASVYANDGTTGSTITCFRSRLPGNRYDIQGKQMDHGGWGWNR